MNTAFKNHQKCLILKKVNNELDLLVARFARNIDKMRLFECFFKHCDKCFEDKNLHFCNRSNVLADELPPACIAARLKNGSCACKMEGGLKKAPAPPDPPPEAAAPKRL